MAEWKIEEIGYNNWEVVRADETYKCSECGESSNKKYRYCPYCGKRMDNNFYASAVNKDSKLEYSRAVELEDVKYIQHLLNAYKQKVESDFDKENGIVFYN